jgi:membrane protein required for beta-lactamase induction
MVVSTWALKIMLKGLSHILKSTPAVMAVLVMSWGSYEYGKYTSPVKTVIKSERKGAAPAPAKKPEPRWMNKVWGN